MVTEIRAMFRAFRPRNAAIASEICCAPTPAQTGRNAGTVDDPTRAAAARRHERSARGRQTFPIIEISALALLVRNSE
jgi:hypothetical protein